MASRLILKSKLEELLESSNVYYQAPEAEKMSYPAIRYTKSDIQDWHANDATYARRTRYDLIVISKTPDHPVIEKLLDLPYCSFDRHYVADNLNHDSLTIYW